MDGKHKTYLASAIYTIKARTGIFHCLRDDLLSYELRHFSNCKHSELSFLLSFLREGDTILDIGAHIGIFAIPLAHAIGKYGKIFAFEPNPISFGFLRRNIKENCLQETIFPINSLVWNKQQKFTMVSWKGNSGGNYFLPITDNNEVFEFKKVILLDQWCKESNLANLNILKIDAEGAEYHILDGGTKMLSKFRPIIYCEKNDMTLKRQGVNHIMIKKLLDGFGYHYFRNTEHRYSITGKFKIERIHDLDQGLMFFDFLAVHPKDHLYPQT